MDLEARVRRLEDILAIQQIFVDYGRALDSGDFATYASLFAADGEVQLGPIGSARGRAAIRALMERTMEGRVGASIHIVSSPQITFVDDDRAASEVMWTVAHRRADGRPELTMMGRHLDDLVRENGTWRIARRRGVIDMPSTFRPVD